MIEPTKSAEQVIAEYIYDQYICEKFRAEVDSHKITARLRNNGYQIEKITKPEAQTISSSSSEIEFKNRAEDRGQYL